MKKNKVLLVVLTIISLTIALVSVSYAWIARRFKPVIEEDNMRIQASSALQIVYDSNSQTQSASLKTFLPTLTDRFEFKQVSSYNGINFFGFDTSGDRPKVVGVPNAQSPTNDDYLNSGIIHFSFRLAPRDNLGSGHLYVLLAHNECGFNISGDHTPTTEVTYQTAFRCSISYTISNVTTTIIFCNDTTKIFYQDIGSPIALDNDAVNEYIDDINSDGKLEFENDDANFYSSPTVVNFNSKSKSDATDTLTSTDKANALCVLTSNQAVQFTVNIWLEGCDPNTVTSINSNYIDFLLKFDALLEED